MTGESQASGDAGHDNGDKVVKITIGGRGEFQGPEADVVERLIIDTERFVGVLHKLVDGQSGIVWLKKTKFFF